MARRQELAEVAASYSAQAAWTEALYGARREALAQARDVLRREPSAVPALRAAVALAFAGAPAEAERAIAGARGQASSDSFVGLVHLPIAQASVELSRNAPARAIAALAPAQPYELGNVAILAPPYLRGLALRQQGDHAGAARELQSVLEHRGVDPFSPFHALARLELARTRALSGDSAGARKEYDIFLELWKGADKELPVLQAARKERAALR
jgi:hypothetical protein